MAELYPSAEQLNSLSGTNDSSQEVLYAPSTSFYKTLYRLLDVARRAGDLRVYKDGDLTFGVRPGAFMDGATAVTYAGAADQPLSDEDTNYIYLTTDGQLHVNQTGFPSASTTPHVPLASITTTNGIYNHSDITDYRGRSMFHMVNGLSSAKANILQNLTATATELNKLHGMTASTTALNKLDGLTANTTELNKLAGLSASTAELNILDGVTATALELNALDGITATVSELNILDGVTATAAELNTLDGVTATTAELNKLSTASANVTAANLNTLTAGSTSSANGLHKHTSLDGKSIGTSGNVIPLLDGANTWSGAQTFSNNIVIGSTTLTATAAEINALHGISSGVAAALPNPANSANGVILAGSDGKVPVGNMPSTYLRGLAPWRPATTKIFSETFGVITNNYWTLDAATVALRTGTSATSCGLTTPDWCSNDGTNFASTAMTAATSRFTAISHTYASSVDATGTIIKWRVKIAPGTAGTVTDWHRLEYIQLTLHDAANKYRNFYLYWNTGTNAQARDGWITGYVHIHDYNYQSVDFDVTQVKRLYLLISGVATSAPYDTPTVIWDEVSLLTNPLTTGLLVLGHDYAYLKQYQVAGYMASLGMRGTFYINSPDNIDANGTASEQMTREQLRQLYWQGHEIAMYPGGTPETHWNDNTNAGKVLMIQQCRTALESLGIDAGVGMALLSTPAGGWSDWDANYIAGPQVLAASGSYDMSCCARPRTAFDAANGYIPYVVGPGTTSSAANALIDNAITNKTVITACLHSHTDEWVTNTKAIVDHAAAAVAAGTLKVITFGQFVTGNF
jgi:hypothetical protein